MHKYQEEDLVTCFENQKIVFIGDSTVRQIFRAIARKIGVQEQVQEDRHADHYVSHRDISVSFIWDPYLNSSTLHRELEEASLSPEVAANVDTTALLLVGGGLWHARYLQGQYLPFFEDSLKDISQTMVNQGKRPLERQIPRSGPGFFETDSLIVLAPVLVPQYELLTPPRAETIRPEKIETMNLYLRQLAIKEQMLVAWSYTLMTAKERRAYQSDGLHVTEAVASNMADVLLNRKCNAVLRRSQTKAYPMDKTCCNNYEPPGWTQSLLLSGSVGVLPLLFLVTFSDPKRLSCLPSRKITHGIMVLALVACYCYFADRTQLFNKAQKQYSRSEFLGFCTIIFMMGILSLRRSVPALQKKSGAQSSQGRDQPFLSRDQTDEWKGWMQLIILIYHYTGASKILWIYQIIRLLVASYLFMSGFGHTLFFYNRADYSLRRCATVLIRLNMLSCILPYMMQTDYLFYYFAPLISFWYIVIYFTMAVGHKQNHSAVFLISKILISATLLTSLIQCPGSFEKLAYILEKSCKIHWDIAEWRFRLRLDGFIVYVGMLCAIVFVRMGKALRSDSPAKTGFDWFIQRHFIYIRVTSGIIAVLVHLIYFVAAHRASSKQEYNGWFPYVSAFPILSFVILRNLNRHTRNFHSSIFAWVGRHSLETFTLQFHIWLAADTKGLLALGILEQARGGVTSGRRFNMAILTTLFLWTCWHAQAATQSLTNWLINPREGGEDIEVERTISNEKELPRTKSKDNTTGCISIGRFSDGVGAGSLGSMSRIRRLLAGHLEARLIIIFGIMWLLNTLEAF